MAEKFVVSSSPHIAGREAVSGIMWRVNAALAPAGIIGIVTFGLSALWLILACVVTALLAEWVIQKARGQRTSVCDGSAFMTGLLLSYNLPPACPLWVGMVGAIFAIAVGKQAFGGIGRNIFNPALAARALLLASWPTHMTSYARPFVHDAVTQATPLALFKEGAARTLADAGLSYWDLFVGNRAGSLGECCIAALLLGAFYLLCKKIITWHIPFMYILTVGVFTWIFGSGKGFFKGDFLFHILSGGLILGAFFMATDYVTSPMTKKGRLVFGLGCGILTAVIRLRGGYPEGVCYAILMMNAAVPLIDRFTQRRRYGALRRETKEGGP